MSAALDSLSHDVRLALRRLLRQPTFTLAVVLTLALGIGANTAIFTVLSSVLLKPLPYPNADELVSVRLSAPGQNVLDLPMGASTYFTLREHGRTFASIGLFLDGGRSLTGQGEPEQARALFATAGALQALGVQPALGRSLTEADTAPEAEGRGAQPILITYSYWQRKFGGDESAVGREIALDGIPSQIVGVMPRSFRFLDLTPEIEVILPMQLDPRNSYLGDFNFNALARLTPGTTVAEAAADIERMLPIWLDAWPEPTNGLTRETFRSWRVAPIVKPLKEAVVGSVSSMLWILMAMIGAVLLIACANVANLMLVRADVRRHEFGVHAALGAGRARLMRDLLVESLLLGVGGGVAGLALAYLGLRALVALGPANLPRLQDIGFDPLVLAFALCVSLISALLFGCLPAIKLAARSTHALVTGNATRGASTSREHHRARGALVVVQVALSLVLLVSSGLMIRTFVALRDVDPGFTDPKSIQVARIWAGTTASSSDPKVYTQMQRTIGERIAALPGVTSAAFGMGAAMEPNRLPSGPLFVEGQTYDDRERPPVTRYKFVSPGYLETVGTRLVAGREFTWDDLETGGRVAVVSERVARELFGSPAAALGKRIRETAPTAPLGAWREVIGVAQNVFEETLDQPPPATVYWPVLSEGFLGRESFGTAAIAYVVRTERAGSDSFVRDLSRAVWSVNADLPVFLVRTVEDLYAASYARTSFVLVLLVIAGGLALVLGLIGVYGVMAYVVSQRQREIGIRLALGARPDKVKTLFVAHGLALAATGVAVGLVAAVALTRLMESLLFGVEPLDVPTFAAGLGVNLVAAAVASWIPARRAATIDPVETLRSE